MYHEVCSHRVTRLEPVGLLEVSQGGKHHTVGLDRHTPFQRP